MTDPSLDPVRSLERLTAEADANSAALRELQRLVYALDQHAIVAITDRQGTITEVNDKFCEISGYVRDELIGQNHRILNSGLHPHAFFKTMWATIGRGETWRGEIRNLAKDGSLYWVDTTIVPLRDEAGQIQQYVAIRAEITDRKRHELELQDLAGIVRSSSDAIVAYDQAGRITIWNPAAERLYGPAADDVLGRPVGDLLPDLAQAPTDACITELTRQGAGGPVELSESAFPLRDDAGKIRGWAHVGRDRTEAKRIERQLIQAGKLAAIGELAGNVAHEVNNPIGIVSGKARLLLSGTEELSPRVRSELEKIVHQCDRIAALTRGLLDYCRPSANPRGPVQLEDPLRKSIEFIRSKATRAGVEVQLELPPALPPLVGSANELEQVFLNLFLNALDAMPQGGRLTVCVRADEATVVVEVRDDGDGIDAETRGRVFEPFFTTKAGRGTGLGLAICYGLVQGHGGQIAVESEPGAGATFRITLPVEGPEGEG